ncbi:hypothetical protein [Pseudomonas laurylsulfativorans]|uniref:hypothetical protein n=1 Tax=Pseudomonas laurylsulfativorans TaxID=1943631 RepID=UPI001981343D|nr:hypothetical protein [Pseudomonas laurylsulfativorans]
MTIELNTATAAPSPWEQATLLINGQKVEWGTELVLFRGQESEVTVEAPPEIARELNLGLVETGGLEPVASPGFGAWVAPVNGKFIWKITPGNGKSGRITLVFFSREVVESWEHRSLVISSNLADEADVRVGGFSVPVGGNWFIRDKAQTVSLVPKSGSPLAGLPVTLTCAIKSGLGISDVVSAPAFGSEQTTYSWVVTGKTRSGTFQLALAGKGMTTPITLAVSKLLSSNLADEADVKIGGVAVSAGGNWFFRDKAQTVTLTPKSGSPLAGLPVTLTCFVKGGLFLDDVVSFPAFGRGGTTYSWTVTGKTRSGRFELKLAGDGMTTPITLADSRLLSNNLADEADVKIGGVAVPAGGNWFIRDKAQTVSLIPKSSSPMAGLPVKLTCAIKSGLDVANVVSTPAFGTEPTAYSWAVTGHTKSGTFQLALAGKGMTTPINVTISKLISSNLSDEAELYVDGSLPPAGDVELERGVHRTISLRAKPNSPIGSYPLMLNFNRGEILPSDVSCTPRLGQVTTSHSWLVGASNRTGRFELVAMDKVGGEIPTQIKLSCRAI